ncbi:MAG: bacteriocin-protection protein [Gemmatimonadetes bacterium]|nr:bacteriocin-protection protein [Gemmatimonadota bacterium]
MEPSDVTHFATSELFRVWLEEHHSTSEALWVGYWKKSTGRPSVTWEETVDEALCFGWIDGIRKRIDDEAYTIRFTPRRAKSVWSHRNIERFEVLSASGRVSSPGRAAYSRRTEDRSGVYSFEQSIKPGLSADYVARLRADDAAWRDWESRPPGYRKQVAHWVMSAKRESTRERRLAALIEDSAAGRKVKPLR